MHTHLRTCSNCASSNSRKSNPSKRRSTTERMRESNLKIRTAAINNFFSVSSTYWISSFSIRHFTLYESRDLLLPTTYVLIRLYKYAREREKLALFMCIAISFFIFFLFHSFQFCRFLFDIDIPFIICVQMKNERRRRKKSWQITLLFSLLNFISLWDWKTKLST